MDETDRKILNLLKKNARASYSEIAQQVSLTSPAVKERIIKMEDTGIIEKYTINIDYQKMGKSITAFIMFETVNCKAFREFCSKQPMVLKYYRIAGYYSYLVKVVAEDMELLEAFIDETMRFGTPSTHIVFSSAVNDSI
ncbi:Lrp/AsnC family transcriptional regulator [Candidatus Enterococcus murrayae]|uniref:Lrp/AsnC family transcriptional regulator n=1 Tax=Candidatus Enterococcus murrayae TaxID=2815321 RepID=A0ABS3HN90_9ENTE|nr:Lrp/AsnC family transcriptional regulator [Enterococcus sp. MJM16]MBO0454927.1 Lrp/AsnC family transcriptional regulator [Enterococcus sp. MJM16]